MRDWQKDWELCQAAQPGPWLFEPGEFECNLECQEEQNCDDEERQNTCPHYRQRTGANIPKIFTIDCGDFDGLNNVDAHFISEAREALPYWLQRVKELEAQRSLVRKGLEKLRDILKALEALEGGEQSDN